MNRVLLQIQVINPAENLISTLKCFLKFFAKNINNNNNKKIHNSIKVHTKWSDGLYLLPATKS